MVRTLCQLCAGYLTTIGWLELDLTPRSEALLPGAEDAAHLPSTANAQRSDDVCVMRRRESDR